MKKRSNYIEFRNQKPFESNHKCRQCYEQCKQHVFVTVLQCPGFRPSKSRKRAKVEALSFSAAIKSMRDFAFAN